MELTSKKRNKTKLVAPYTYAECMGISFKNGLYLKMPFLFMLSCTKTLKHFLLMKLKDYFSLVCTSQLTIKLFMVSSFIFTRPLLIISLYNAFG